MLDYFDAFVIGLTATPNKQALGFFNQNLVMEYTHEQAVADAVNVDFDVYRIRTEITEGGSTVEAGLVTEFRDRQTRATPLGEARRGGLVRRRGARPRRRRQGSDPHGARDLQGAALHRDLPGPHARCRRRSSSPRTTRTPTTSSRIVREVFGKGDDFAAKITYKATGRKTDELIASFRNSLQPARSRSPWT